MNMSFNTLLEIINNKIRQIVDKDAHKLKNMITKAWIEQFNTASSTARVKTGALRDSYKPTNDYKNQINVLDYGNYGKNKEHFVKHLIDLENNLDKVSL